MAFERTTQKARLVLSPTTISVRTVPTPATADTEFTIDLTATAVSFTIRTREPATLYIGDDTGFTSTYFTIPSGNSWTGDGIYLQATTLYLKCNKASQIVEILEHVGVA